MRNIAKVENIPFQCTVYSGNVGVNFYSEIKLTDLFSDYHSHKFFPEFSLSCDELIDGFSVYYISEKHNNLEWSSNKLIASFPFEDLRQGETILHLGYPFIELQRQRRCGVTIHAAACSFGKNAVLILGKEGSGKTSTVIKLCQERGAKLIANDLCLIESRDGMVYLTGGTKLFCLRYISVLKSLPHLLPFFLKKEDTADLWRNKIQVLPSELNIQVETESIPLSKAYLVHIDENQNELVVKKANNLNEKVYINENFSRYIRNTCMTFLGNNNSNYIGFVPSLDEEQLYENRVKIIDFLFNNCNLSYVSGNSTQICEFINSAVV